MVAHSKMDLLPATPASGVGPLASDVAEQSLWEEKVERKTRKEKG